MYTYHNVERDSASSWWDCILAWLAMQRYLMHLIR
jgi:hypothetical protein